MRNCLRQRLRRVLTAKGVAKVVKGRVKGSCVESSKTAIAQGADGKGRGKGGKRSCEGGVARNCLRQRLRRVLTAKGVAKAAGPDKESWRLAQKQQNLTEGLRIGKLGLLI